ncbi:hypothetical protein ACFQ22_09805 [Lentilactobacillus raoultii]|uniref:Uncharacterized protein n=1 Tax=Lentilactobacillus raoultii TaxID=1987503 RepID=A0ABW3PHT2_9LACO|nr:hypothetical protein [Lentilactobacillus raoultii]
MNLDEFYRATATLNRKFTLLLAKEDHFVPVNQLTKTKGALFLASIAKSKSGTATITLDQFLTRTRALPPQTNLRTLTNRQLVFGFRIVNKSIVFY